MSNATNGTGIAAGVASNNDRSVAANSGGIGAGPSVSGNATAGATVSSIAGGAGNPSNQSVANNGSSNLAGGPVRAATKAERATATHSVVGRTGTAGGQ